MTSPRVARICIGTVCACLLLSCASAPPETDYRLGQRKHTACHAVAAAPTRPYFAALCDVLVKEDMSGRDYNETVEIISIPDGQLVDKAILNLVEHGIGPFRMLAEIEFSPDGSKLAVTTGTGIFRILDAKTLEPLGPSQPASLQASALTFAINGELLAVAFDASVLDQAGYVTIYDTVDLQEIRRLVIDTADSILSLAFSNDARLLAVATADQAAGRVRVYDWMSGNEIDAVRHTRPVTSVLFSRDDSGLLTLSEDLKVFRGGAADGEGAQYRQSSSAMAIPGIWAMQDTEIPAGLSAVRPLPRMKVSPDGRFLAVADADDRINLLVIDPLERRCETGVAQSRTVTAYAVTVRTIDALSPYPSDLAWLPDGSRIVAAFANDGLQLTSAKCVRDDFIDVCRGFRIEPGDHEVDLAGEAASKLDEEMERAFFDGNLFGRGDLVTVHYRLIEYKARNTAAWLLTGFGAGSATVAAEFLDASGELLLATRADSKSRYDPHIDTLGEGMMADDRLAFRRVAEEFAAHAATHFGCRAGGTEE